MRAVASACVVGVWLAGCAGPTGPQLRADTVDMGPAFGPLQQRQILENVSRMIDDPWSMPGHVEVSSGTLQVQDQAALDWKLPYTGITAAKAVREFDVNNLQSQEQHSFIISPVTDGDDLRRLHAVYQYAICDNPALFQYEWGSIIRPYSLALQVAQKNNPQFLAQRDLAKAQAQLDKARADDLVLKNRITKLLNVTNPTPAQKAELQEDQKKETILAAEIVNLQQYWQDLFDNYQKYTQQLRAAMAVAPGGAAAAPSQGQTQSQSGGQQDTIEVETFKGQMIDQILRGPRWLGWRSVSGTNSYVCPLGSAEPEIAFDGHRGWQSLGVYGRYELFTNNPEKMSEFMMIAAGSIPNTAGVHNLGSVLQSSGSTNSPAKAGMVTYFKTF